MLRRVMIGGAAIVAVAVAGAFLLVRSLLAGDAVRQALEAQGSAALGQPVKIARASASLFPRVSLQLHDVAIGRPAAVTLKRVSVATGLVGLFSRRVEDASLVVTDSRIVLPLPRLSANAPAGAGAADGTGAPGASPGFTVASVRAIVLRNVELVAGDHVLRLDLESALEGDRLEVDRLVARSGRTALEGRGTLTSLARLEGTLGIEANPLDLDELLTVIAAIAAARDGAAAHAPGTGTPAAPAAPVMLRIDLKAPTGRAAGYDFADLAATLHVAPTGLSLAPARVALFGGRFDGTLDVDTSGSPPAVALRGTMAGVDVAELAKVAGSPGAATGRLGGTISIVGRGTDSQAMLRQARGTVDAIVTDGTIPGLEMVRGVVLAFGRPSGAPPPGSGSAFSRLGGTFAVGNGIARSGNLSLASRDFDLRGGGTMALVSGALDLRTEVVLSEELTAQAGRDLRRYAQENGRVVVPARIGGTVARPMVSIDVGQALGRALRSELEREAKSLLGGLFRKKKP